MAILHKCTSQIREMPTKTVCKMALSAKSFAYSCHHSRAKKAPVDEKSAQKQRRLSFPTGVSPEVQKTLEVQNSVLRVNSPYQRSSKNTGIRHTILIACMRSLKANGIGEQTPKFENWCCSTSRGPAKFGADFASVF